MVQRRDSYGRIQDRSWDRGERDNYDERADDARARHNRDAPNAPMRGYQNDFGRGHASENYRGSAPRRSDRFTQSSQLFRAGSEGTYADFQGGSETQGGYVGGGLQQAGWAQPSEPDIDSYNQSRFRDHDYILGGHESRHNYQASGWEPTSDEPNRGYGRAPQSEHAAAREPWRGNAGDAYRSSYTGSSYSQQPHYGAHHHDPDYGRWRHEQLSGMDTQYSSWRDDQARKLDDEYHRYRQERHAEFSGRFEDWRSRNQGSQSQNSQADRSDSSTTGAGNTGTHAASSGIGSVSGGTEGGNQTTNADHGGTGSVGAPRVDKEKSTGGSKH